MGRLISMLMLGTVVLGGMGIIAPAAEPQPKRLLPPGVPQMTRTLPDFVESGTAARMFSKTGSACEVKKEAPQKKRPGTANTCPIPK